MVKNTFRYRKKATKKNKTNKRSRKNKKMVGSGWNPKYYRTVHYNRNGTIKYPTDNDGNEIKELTFDGNLENDFIDFWKDFIPEQDIPHLRNLLNDPLNCNVISSMVTKYMTRDNANNYNAHICYLMLLIGILSHKLKDKCTLLIKGGKAAQIAISSLAELIPDSGYINTYGSNDIDVLVIPKTTDEKYSARNIALRIGEFIVWLSNNRVFSSLHKEVTNQANPSIALDGSIVKISVITKTSPFAISDIGYVMSGPINEYGSQFTDFEISDVIEYDKNTKNTQTLTMSGEFYSETIDDIIHEKIYYLHKYTNKENKDDTTLNKIRESSVRTLNYLLDALSYHFYYNRLKINSDMDELTLQFLVDLYENNEKLDDIYGELETKYKDTKIVTTNREFMIPRIKHDILKSYCDVILTSESEESKSNLIGYILHTTII